MIKKSIRIFLGVIILLVLLILYLLSDFNPLYQNEDFRFITKEVKNSQKENLNHIVEIHNKIYERIEENDCPCQFVSNNIPTNSHSSLFKKALYHFKIKKDFTHEECLKFLLLHYDFGYDNKGIENASKFYFKKNINQLNKTELLSLIAMLKNSVLYNPIRNKEKLRNRVLVFEKILENEKH
ncbi:transglycosylase domain-containing protein [Flavobacterium ustbae]|uniref:transglycosylase domain-containing protein n=1 Tax=Flavobacterium ustbae TaxID=2488790 RepID=UPI000F799E26|nr:transglycosylase domain-containing protein [Flavobacterium ustbae]